MKDSFAFDWSDLAFGGKKPLRELKATFIAAPRELSATRLKQLIKEYLSAGNIVLGLAKEPFVDGFVGQPHFRTLQAKDVQKIIDQVNAAGTKNKVYTLQYFQRELPFVLEKGGFRAVLLVRGSWQHTFHNSKAYYVLVNSRTKYEYVSPFVNEDEARKYEVKLLAEMNQAFWPAVSKGPQAEKDMLELASKVAQFSYDYSFQTGVALGRPRKNGTYDFVAAAFNKVVPYQTYALHHGASREQHFSPPNDLNYYDAVHAEVMLITNAAREKLDLAGSALFINLLPCPTCARMLTQTDIAEFVYTQDHSDGYAIRMLEATGKKVRRIVP